MAKQRQEAKIAVDAILFWASTLLLKSDNNTAEEIGLYSLYKINQANR